MSKGKSKATGPSNVAAGKKGLGKKKTGSSNVAAGPSKCTNPAATKSVPTTLPGPDSTNFTTVPAQSTASEQFQILQNIHNTVQFMQKSTGQALPPSLVETNNILRELMVIAKKITFGKECVWKLVAQQLGLTQNEGYMNFMNQIDEAKKYCAINDTTQPAATNDTTQPVAAADVVGTQHSEVASTQMGINKQKVPTN
ncbi:hypothetical protein SESBI_02197 [Sesbania bispinosa]|nr:hypothetical protein SESBI_02197 [Sesbania bispinosa]